MSINISKYSMRLADEKDNQAKISLIAIPIISFIFICFLISLIIFTQKKSTKEELFESRQNTIIRLDNKSQLITSTFVLSIGIIIILSECIWILARKTINDREESQKAINNCLEEITSKYRNNTNDLTNNFFSELKSAISGFSLLSSDKAISKFNNMIINLLNICGQSSSNKNITETQKGSIFPLLSHKMDELAKYAYDNDNNISAILNFAKLNFDISSSNYFSLYAIMSTFKDASLITQNTSLKNTLSSIVISKNKDINRIFSSLNVFYKEMQPEKLTENLITIYKSILNNQEMWINEISETFYDYSDVISNSFNKTKGFVNKISNNETKNLISQLENIKFSGMPASMQIGLSQVDDNLDPSLLVSALNNLHEAWYCQKIIRPLITKLNLLKNDFQNLKTVTTNEDFWATMKIITKELSSTDIQVNQLHDKVKNIFPKDYMNRAITSITDKMQKLKELFPKIKQILDTAEISTISSTKNAINELAFFPLFVKSLYEKKLIPNISPKIFLRDYTTTNTLESIFMSENISMNTIDESIFKDQNFTFNWTSSAMYLTELAKRGIKIEYFNIDTLISIMQISQSFKHFLDCFCGFFKEALLNNSIIIQNQYDSKKQLNLLPHTIGTKYLSQIFQQRDLLIDNIKSRIIDNQSNDLQTIINNDLHIENPHLQRNLKKYLGFLFAIMQINAFIDCNYSLARISHLPYHLSGDDNFDSSIFTNISSNQTSII